MLEGARLRDAQAAGVTECPKGANPERVCTGECPCAAGAGTCTDRGRTSYPARINADGVVTELEGFGAAGSTYDISTDGSVIIGSLGCEDPPTCTSSICRPYRWTGSADPEVMYRSGIPRALSATGTIVAGEYYDTIPVWSATSSFVPRAINRHGALPLSSG